MVEMIVNCPDCGPDQLFEQYHPAAGDCPDSPDGCCSEWSCTECGTALLLGFAFRPAEVASASEPARRVA